MLAPIRAGSAGVLLIALLAAAPAPSAGTSVLQPMVTISGANSHITTARCLRITTQEAWAALWLEHLGETPKPKYDLYYNQAGLPVVDFEHCMVVAVFQGATSNCAGVSAVTGPLEDPEAETKTPVASGDEVLRLSWHGYQTMGPDGGAVGASPFGFFVLPRTEAPLVVQDREMPLGGGHGRIVERARLPALAAGGR
jgi:hypothetical protein